MLAVPGTRKVGIVVPIFDRDSRSGAVLVSGILVFVLLVVGFLLIV